jgi:hypothetical protein
VGDPPGRGVPDALITRVLCERQLRKTVRTAEGHLLWKGGLANGHPAVKHQGRTVYLKRILWEATHGPIPGDLVVVSACRKRTLHDGQPAEE